MRRIDRLIGIVLGLVVGAAIVVGFVFWGSEQTIDPASLGDGGGNHGGRQEQPAQPPVQTVRVVGGAPPAEGAPTFDYRKGDRVRLRVISDGAVAIEVVGLGIDRSVPANQPTLIEFKAREAGNFPLIVTASHIGVANVRVGVGPEL